MTRGGGVFDFHVLRNYDIGAAAKPHIFLKSILENGLCETHFEVSLLG